MIYISIFCITLGNCLFNESKGAYSKVDHVIEAQKRPDRGRSCSHAEALCMVDHSACGVPCLSHAWSHTAGLTCIDCQLRTTVDYYYMHIYGLVCC